jgi:hypothetical protein
MEIPASTLTAGTKYRIVADSPMGQSVCTHRFIRYNSDNEPLFECPVMGTILVSPAYGWKFYPAIL